eukprot:TRINITY_DN61736_c0_g1_i1.p1 TRINITY_DN61736_c0_g1~~TRINITY_DN61736_c0_g1_i1.p1  ORF type:complete len:1748 (-),score=421.10 TRINITY_DN61736_c0_g1_i1:40-5283(-)
MDLTENADDDVHDDDESESEGGMLEDGKYFSPTVHMMPPSYSSFLPDERNVWASKLISSMQELLLDPLDDGIRKVLREWKRFLKCGYKLTLEDHSLVLQIIIELFQKPIVDTRTLHACLAWISYNIPKKKIEKMKLVIPCRLFIKMEKDLRKRATHGMEPETRRIHGELLLAVHCIRNLFEESAFEEIIEEYSTLICPFDESVSIAMELLSAFLPTKGRRAIEFVPRMMEMWKTEIEKPDVSSSMIRWFSVVARQNPGQVLWDEYLPQVLTVLLRHLRLRIGKAGDQQQSSCDKDSIVESLHDMMSPALFRDSASGVFLINAWDPRSPSSLSCIRSFIDAIESFFHPSSIGNWVGSLGKLLSDLARALRIRVFNERNFGEEREIPEDFQLQQKKLDEMTEILLPAIRMALFSGNTSLIRSAVFSVRDLARLCPVILFESLKDDMSKALVTLTESHQTVAVLRALRYTLVPFIEVEGLKDVVFDLLLHALPGFDVNDRKKLVASCKLFKIAFSVIPLVPENDLVEGIVAEFTQRLLSVLRSGHIFTHIEDDDVLPLSFESLCETFFNQLHENYIDSVIPKFFDFMFGSVDDESLIGLTIVLESLSRAHPSKCHAFFIHQLQKKMMVVHSNGKKSLAPLSKLEIKWYGRVLSSICRRGGISLLGFRREIECIVDGLLNVSGEDTRKYALKIGGKVVKSLLYSLTHVYVKEFRSMNEDEWSVLMDSMAQCEKPESHDDMCALDRGVEHPEFLRSPSSVQTWRLAWAKYYLAKDVKPNWHCPCEEEWSWAESIVKKYIRPLLEELRVFVSYEGDDIKSQFSIRKMIEIFCVLRSALKGTYASMNSITPDDSQTLPEMFGRDGVTQHRVVCWTHPNGRQLLDRIALLPILTQVGRRLMTEYEDDVQVLNRFVPVLFSVYNFLCYRYGDGQDRAYAQSIRELSFSMMLCVALRSHWLHVLEAYHAYRISAHLQRQKPTPEDVEFINMLLDLSTSVYEGVRWKALDCIALVPFAFSHEFAAKQIPRVIEHLQACDGTPKGKAQLEGAIDLVDQFWHIIRSRWDLLGQIRSSCWKNLYSEEIGVMKALGNLERRVSTYRNTAPLLMHNGCEIENRVHHYKKCVNSFIELHPTLPWKKLFYGLHAMSVMMRPEIPPDPRLVKIVLKELNHDIPSVRTVARLAFARLGRIIKPRQPMNVIETDGKPVSWEFYSGGFPRTKEEMNVIVFHDQSYYGYYSQPRKCRVYDYSKQLETSREHRESVLAIQEHFQNASIVEDLINKTKGEGNRASGATALGYMFRIAGRPLLKHIEPHLDGLLEDCQSHSSESLGASFLVSALIAGLARGSRHWPIEDQLYAHDVLKTIAAKLWKSSDSDIIRTIWYSLSRSVDRSDPRRLQWLWDVLREHLDRFDSLLSTEQKTVSVVLTSLISECGWRYRPVNEWAISLLRASMSHPFSQVRDILAALIGSVMRNCWDLAQRNFKLPIEPLIHELLQTVEKDDIPSKKLMISFLRLVGSVIPSRVLDQFAPSVIRFALTVKESGDENMGRNVKKVINTLSRAEYLDVSAVLSELLDIMKEPSWRNRVSVMGFMSNYVFFNALLLQDPRDQKTIERIFKRCLLDDQLEVRQSAVAVLSRYLLISPDEKQQEMLEIFLEWSRTRASRKSRDPWRLIRRHGGVLGLSAVVLSHPFDIPKWMVPVIGELASHAQDPAPIPASVRQAFSRFWRTQKDTWHINSSQFDEEERLALTELMISPSYYA